MKNQFLLFLCLLFSPLLFSQKEYSFNYMIEYDYQFDESSKLEKLYFLTNSNDNSYLLTARLVDSGYVNLDFFDEKGIRSLSSVKQDVFFEFKGIGLKCEFVMHQKEAEKKQNDRYIFAVNQDTIIESTEFNKHKFKYKSKFESKKYDKGYANYIVEPNTEFHKPLMAFSFSFDVTLRNDDMENGIAKEIFTTNYKQDKKKFIYKLIRYTEVEKSLTIPKECCLTH